METEKNKAGFLTNITFNFSYKYPACVDLNTL